MIHELIDQKKRTFRSSTGRSTKTVSDNSRNLAENPNLEQSDNDNKEVDSSSTTFIPPWLRNSLGLNQRTKQNLDWSVCLPNFNALGNATSDQKSARIIPRYKEQNNNDFEDLKKNFDEDCSIELTDHIENRLPKNSDAEIALTREPDVIQASCNNAEKAVFMVWENMPKDSEVDLITSRDSKLLKREESTLTSTEIIALHEIDQIRDEEKKGLKLTRQKNSLKRRAVNDQKPSELGKDEVNLFLEMKACEVLHDSTKTIIHSSSSDIKQLEAKLIWLSTKCDGVDVSKLDAQELRLLQEIKEQTGGKEDFEKLIEHIKEANLKEILRGPDGMTKAFGDKLRKVKENINSKEKEGGEMKDIIQNSKFNENGKNSNLDKDSVVSTDDESDIKRFSEFLSKNKNVDEKRKCLEEVRNYFEKKRRTRMTKRRPMDESKISKSFHSGDKKDNLEKDKEKVKDVSVLLNGKEKKLKFRCDEEVVEKAVNETLQKFVNLYHFHVSPSVLGTVRKNILQAIQSDSLEINHSKQSLKSNQENGENPEVKKTEKPCLDKESGFNDKEEHKDQACIYMNGGKMADDVFMRDFSNKKGKEINFKTLPENSDNQAQKPVQGNDIVENELIKRLKREFKTFLNSIQDHTNITGLKLQSIILETEEHSSSKNLQYIYNFTKNSLESNEPNHEHGPSFVKEEKISKTYKDAEVQTAGNTDVAKRNIKIQTCSIKVCCDQNVQTENASFVTSDVQTDELGITLKELRNLKGDDISTGLYRMIKSREKGKFYLYPKDLDESKAQSVDNKSNTSLLQSHDCATNTDINEISRKASFEGKISKERNILFKEKESKFRKNRRNNVYTSCLSQKFAAKKENLVPDLENSLSCLFFRNSANKTPESETKTNLTTDERMLYKGDTSKKGTKDAAQENHLGCVWFWNGEKITPGCDLKVHVEDLLTEKLKEISSVSGHGNKLFVNDRSMTKDENHTSGCPVKKSASGPTNIELQNIFCYERDSIPAVETPPLIFSEGSEGVANEKKVEEDDSAQNVRTIILDGGKNEEKRVRDVGTQNSEQTFLSLNVTRLKSRSRTESLEKCCKRKSKKKSFLVKPVRENQRSRINIKKPLDVGKAVQKLKKMKLKIEKIRSSETETSSSLSIAEGSTSSSTSKKFSEDPVAVIFSLRKNVKGDCSPVVDVKNKIRKIIGLVDHEVQTNNRCNVDQDYCAKKTSKLSQMENSKHWELIENILNRISQRERESLWSDVSDFIKKKIGRDINDEGAREVCIEIEQDMPKLAQGLILGRTKHAVLAIGHYKRNEGDVEVEIDLTLDDLERILRRRQKKIRRQQWSSTSKSRKLFSSSSTHSDSIKTISLKKAGLENLIRKYRRI